MPADLPNSGELEVLAILWEGGALKPAEIQERLPFEIKNSALRWQLGELVAKGWVERRREGKAFVYSARKARRSVFGGLAQRLKQTLFGGSALAMVGELIDSGALSENDLRELAKQLQAKNTKRTGAK